MQFFAGGHPIHRVLAPPAPPVCCRCGKPAPFRRTQDGAMFCGPCRDEEIRTESERNVKAAITVLFQAVKVEQRSRLYRGMASVLHPDVGGSEDLMKSTARQAAANAAPAQVLV